MPNTSGHYHHRDPDSEVAFVTWQALATLPRPATSTRLVARAEPRTTARRKVRFPGRGTREVDVIGASALTPGQAP